MIDKVRLRRRLNLDTTMFNTRRFTYDTYYHDGVEYRYYRYNCTGVIINYSSHSRILTIEGRLINLSRVSNRVDTLDALWAGIPSIDDMLIEDIDSVLNNLKNTLFELTGYRIDVRRFHVSYLEICFNICTENVGSYLYQFNDIFRFSDKSRYKNYIISAKQDWHTGFYVKTNKDYKLNKKDNYVINFYDKYQQLLRMREDNQKDDYGSVVTQDDLDRARNILRLELKCGYNFLRQLKRSHCINGEFQDFLNIDFCSSILKGKYISFIDRYEYCNFHTYDSTISVVNQSCLATKEKQAMRDYCRLLASRTYRSKSKSTRAKYEGMLADLQIHPILMHSRPMNSDVSMLPAPMTLLDQHVELLKRQRNDFREHYKIPEHLEVYREDVSNELVELQIDDMVDLFRES